MSGTELIAYFSSHAAATAAVLACILLAGLTLLVHRQTAAIRASARQMADLQEAVAAYAQTLIVSRTMLERMEHRISDFTDRNLEIQSQLAFNRSFEEAARLVKDGGTVESLVSGCGLSDAEAALMVRLHQRDREKPRQQWRAKDVRPDAGVRETNAADSALTAEEIRLQESIRAAQSSR